MIKASKGLVGAGSGTFSQLSVFSLLFSVVLGLDSRLAKDALESAWFTVEIAIDENAVNTSHSTHMVMRRMSTNKNYNDGAELLNVEAETELQNRIWGRHGSHTTFQHYNSAHDGSKKSLKHFKWI